MGHDDTYQGGQDGWDKSTLVKNLTSDCFGDMKGFQKFMVGLNPTQVHWQAVFIDAENNEIYSHFSLGTNAPNVEKVVEGFQKARILNNGVSVHKCKIVSALHNKNGWSCGDHMIFAAFKFLFGELKDIRME
eukprot:5475658-Ditylum_brightwellii.AAC.1